MSSVVYRRPARRPEPEYPSGEVLLEPPPEVPGPSGRGWSQMVTMVPMLAGSGSMALMFAGQRGGPLAYLTGGMFGLSAIGMLASQLGQGSGPGEQEMLTARRYYMRHLSPAPQAGPPGRSEAAQGAALPASGPRGAVVGAG